MESVRADLRTYDEMEIIDVNVTSAVHLAKRLLTDLVSRNDGKQANRVLPHSARAAAHRSMTEPDSDG